MFRPNLRVLWLLCSVVLFCSLTAQAAKPTADAVVVPPAFPKGLSLQEGKLTLSEGWNILNEPTLLDSNPRCSLIPFNQDKSVDVKLGRTTLLFSVTQADGTPLGVCRYEVGNKTRLVYVPYFFPPREKIEFKSWRTYKSMEGKIEIGIDYTDGERPKYYRSVWLKRNNGPLQELLKGVSPPTREEGEKQYQETLARALAKGKGTPESQESAALRQKAIHDRIKKNREAAVAQAEATPAPTEPQK